MQAPPDRADVARWVHRYGPDRVAAAARLTGRRDEKKRIRNVRGVEKLLEKHADKAPGWILSDAGVSPSEVASWSRPQVVAGPAAAKDPKPTPPDGMPRDELEGEVAAIGRDMDEIAATMRTDTRPHVLKFQGKVLAAAQARLDELVRAADARGIALPARPPAEPGPSDSEPIRAAAGLAPPGAAPSAPRPWRREKPAAPPEVSEARLVEMAAAGDRAAQVELQRRRPVAPAPSASRLQLPPMEFITQI